MGNPGHIFKVLRHSQGKIQDSYLVEKSQFLIGRNTEAEVPVTDLSVSRRHLVITLENDQIFLEDQKTPGGTRVAGSTLVPHRPTSYNPGDPIQIGKCEDTFTLEIYRNHLTDEQLSSEVARAATLEAEALALEAKANFEKTLERAKIEAEGVLSHARLEAAEIQKKAHFELLKIQQTASSEEAKLLEKARGEVEVQKKAMAEELNAQRSELLERAQRDAQNEFKRTLDEKESAWEGQKSHELETLKANLQKQMDQKLAAAEKALKEAHTESTKKAEATLKALKEEAQKYHEEIARHKQELSEQRREAEEFQTELKSEQKLHAELTKKIKNEQEILQKVTGEISEAQKKLSAHQKDLKKTERLQNTVEKLNQQHEELLSSLKELEGQQSERKKEIAALSKELEQNKKEALTQQKKDLQLLRESAEKDHKEQLAALTEQLQSRRHALEKEFEDLERERKAKMEADLEAEKKKFKKTLPKKVRKAVKVTLSVLKKSWASSDQFSEIRKDLGAEIQDTLERLFLDEPLPLESDSFCAQTDPEITLVDYVEQEAPEIEDPSIITPPSSEPISVDEILSEEHSDTAEKRVSAWKVRIAVALLLASLAGTAYLLRENIKAFGTAENSSSAKSLEPLDGDEIPQFMDEDKSSK